MKNIKQEFQKLWQSPMKWPIIIALITAFLIGYIIHSSLTTDRSHQHAENNQKESSKVELWTCSMHPQIKQPNPGKCPICGMDLIPVSDDKMGPRELKLTPRAIKRAGIQTSPVESRYVAAKIRLVGKVKLDETRIKYITAWIPGRIDRIFVDYTGIRIRKGDHLVSLYSPQLITAQQELIEAKKMSFRTQQAARKKLKLWGLTHRQINDIEKQKQTKTHLTIYSPIGGIVIQKNASEGMYVKTGTRIYTIADLSFVWIKLDAYESDLPWIRYAQTVEFETEAYPGEIFKGKIAFIDPIMDPKTRTVKVRVNVPNPEGRLKPEMFVHATIHSKLSAHGKVMDEDLMGKWISPMHPEIIKNHPGKCDICGMPLVKAEKLGYISSHALKKEKPLVIPSSSPLLTGTRSVVYVASQGREGIFEGREVVLGPKAGDYYLVKEGLHEGERVVTNGAFKIDSDLQIKAKPSMMSPQGGIPAPSHHHQKHQNLPKTFQKSINELTSTYLSIQKALSTDNFKKSLKEGNRLFDTLKNVNMNLFKGDEHIKWMILEKKLKKNTQNFIKSTDIKAARIHFALVSTQVISMIKQFGIKTDMDIYLIHCPMAMDNKGASWLQDSPDVKNPYFGASMLLCHDSKEKIFEKKEK